MSNVNLKLKGQYQVKIFDKNNNLKSDSEFLDNIITDSGLRFPFDLAFADSFRYLSIGSGTNTAIVGDTGLYLPISKFQYMGIYKKLDPFIDSASALTSLAETNYSENYAYVPEGCGTTFTPSGVQLYRTWRLPTGTDTFTENYLTSNAISELMVSPSAPIEQKMMTGGMSSYIPFTSTGYHNLAFSRINLASPFQVESGDYAFITYRLSILTQTGVSGFSGVRLNVSNFRTNAGTPCTGWTGNLFGSYGIVNPGIKLISDQTGPVGYTPSEFDAQGPGEVESFYTSNKFGITYTPRVGYPLEPFITDSNYYYCYTSDDNTQFFANASGGPIPNATKNSYYPFSSSGIRSSGVCSYRYNMSNSSTEIFNIRKTDEPSYTSTITYPSESNITSSQTVTASSRPSTSFTFSYPGGLSKGFSFFWASNSAYKVSSLVMSVKDKEASVNKYYPFFDMIFGGTNGQLLPYFYNNNPNTGFTPISDSNKLFFDNIHSLNLNFKLTWGR